MPGHRFFFAPNEVERLDAEARAVNGILIAGIGNIFKGDDAFGVEVVARLARRRLPDGVKVVDFGIRGIDLTYALLDGYGAAVLIDTMRHGEMPGTVSVIEPEPASDDDPADLTLSPHDLDPAKVLRWCARSAAPARACSSSPASR